MNMLFIWWGIIMLAICGLAVIVESYLKEHRRLREENSRLRKENELLRIHCDTKIAFADFAADCKVMDYRERVKQLEMINHGFKKELDHRIRVEESATV